MKLNSKNPVDTLTPTERSYRMSLVRSTKTKPEKVVRRIIRFLGYRFRSHVKTLPGSPDFVFPKQKKVIFVHGCFWHQHGACRKDGKPRMPKSKLDYWLIKLKSNRKRDSRVQRRLNQLGWSYFVVWECRLKTKSKLARLPSQIKALLARARRRTGKTPVSLVK
jgi:DNA mismatch endonuclease (patch repair protein)